MAILGIGLYAVWGRRKGAKPDHFHPKTRLPSP
ncbi:MAG: hypothetical protein UZ18_ATM001002468, partial [Armatimonadetes bacterium OLB18]